MSWFLDPALPWRTIDPYWSIQLVRTKDVYRRHFGWAFCLCISKFFWLPTTHFKASKATKTLEMQMECHHTSCYQVGTYWYETYIPWLPRVIAIFEESAVAASSGWVWAAWAMIHGIFEQGFKLLDFPSLWRTYWTIHSMWFAWFWLVVLIRYQLFGSIVPIANINKI